jgi:hypothetical protein
MPAKDIYHEAVKNALVKDGWTVTDDPLYVAWAGRDLFVDFGAEKLLSAEKNGRKIAVEVKSFVGLSEIEDLKNALGQYVLYRNALALAEPERELFLAIREAVFSKLFIEPDAQFLLKNEKLRLIVFDSAEEKISQWIN